MIITTPNELRLTFPTHAIDSIDPLVGVIDNSEHDFLMEKLGQPLYDKLCDYYDHNRPVLTNVDVAQTGYYNRLLLICQRIVAYDAMSRAIGMHIVSVNNAGVNISTAQDYEKVDLEAVRTFKQTCVKEAHASINRLLCTLEKWCKQAATIVPVASASGSALPADGRALPSAAVPVASASGSPEGSSAAVVASAPATDPERDEIITLWRQSRYYYLAAGMVIPSSDILITYWTGFYDSREKFIQMLPDIRYIQEEVLYPNIGEDFIDELIKEVPEHCDVFAANAPVLLIKTLIKLRKAAAVMLEERTQVVNTEKTRRAQAHDEAVRLLQAAITYIQQHQEQYNEGGTAEEPTKIYAALKLSPLYVAPVVESAAVPSAAMPSQPTEQPKFENNRPDSGMFVTPFLN